MQHLLPQLYLKLLMLPQQQSFPFKYFLVLAKNISWNFLGFALYLLIFEQIY